ncbi:hypothetical protein COY62_00445 [bacterium (Candidatus Howlettbacteria) CG_4_10_14_0_8_um_filter_40_9]|nr:MAG: hypothetical protein COY62_00445 [bacterium (Candidatus Howlettbacteria) CG_4_10_14_0_8_um_filter_40_9]
MKYIDVLRMSFGNLRRNKLRTFLTVTGVVVGIGAIVFLVSLGFGLQELAVSKVANLEALTLITVNSGSGADTALNETAVKKFEVINNVNLVSPILSTPAQIKNGEKSADTVVYGINPAFIGLEDVKPKWGENISEKDEKGVILSQAVVKGMEIDDPTQIIRKELNFNLIQLDDSGNIKNAEGTNVSLKVTGVTSEDKTKYSYANINILKGMDGKKYNSVKVQVKKRNDLADVRKAIESMGYPTTSIKDTVDQIDKAFVVIKSVLGGFGFVALFVAAIGIFNTMTISLLERTHEIGIMKAIGARNKDVSRIFTAEASIIGLMGGFSGVFAGWLGGAVINSLANYMATQVGGEQNHFFSTPLWFGAGVVTFAFLVSTISGIYPAKRAARLDPLEALRYE